MSKVLAVFGATGQQGGSVVNYVLNDPELSQQYKVRAITRDVNSEKAKQLKEKVEVVQGDPLNRASLETALAGVHTVFIMTVNYFIPGGPDIQYNSGKTMVDVAVEKGAEYIIFSTLPSVKEVSGGKYVFSLFDVKAEIEKYIRGLAIKSAFFSAGSFMDNFQSQTTLALQPAPDGTWVMARHFSPKTKWPLIDAVGDTGKFVGAILANPDKYEGKTFCAATALYTTEELIATISKATGKTVIFKQISRDDFKKTLPPEMADTLADYFSYIEEFGYYGPDSEKLVAWAAANARGRLHTFEEYLEMHPVQLE
ncbi:NAD(P)-binding protein [Hypoxylon sp. FL1857]|nr:NAD(P)-binding protein [Hypoxylon sp. FL1857]